MTIIIPDVKMLYRFILKMKMSYGNLMLKKFDGLPMANANFPDIFIHFILKGKMVISNESVLKKTRLG